MQHPPISYMSRIYRLPSRADRHENYPKDDNVDLLVYYRGLDKTQLDAVQVALSNALGTSLPTDPKWEGHYDWNMNAYYPALNWIRQVHVLGEGNDLMNAYDEVIDAYRDQTELLQYITEKFRYAFGDAFVLDREIGDVVDSVIELAKGRLKVRLREQTSNIFKDQNISVTDGAAPQHTNLTKETNRSVHYASLTEDLLCSQIPSVDVNDPLFAYTGNITVAQFQANFGLRHEEATAIIFYATNVSADGVRTDLGDLFSWIYQFITEFIRWRKNVFWMWYRLGWRHQFWNQKGGLLIDSLYHQFIDEVFKIVNAIQMEWTFGEQMQAPFRRMANLLIAYIDLLQWNIVSLEAWRQAKRDVRDFLETTFPADMPREYSQARIVEPFPGTRIAAAPIIPNPRERIVVNPLLYNHKYDFIHVGFPPSWNGERVFTENLHMDTLWGITRYIKTTESDDGGGGGGRRGSRGAGGTGEAGPGGGGRRGSRGGGPGGGPGGGRRRGSRGVGGTSEAGPSGTLAQAVRFADDSVVSEEEEEEEGFRFHDVDSEPEPTPYNDLYENIVDSSRLPRKHVSFAVQEDGSDKSSPARFSSGHSLKRRPSHDVHGAPSVKRPRSVV